MTTIGSFQFSSLLGIWLIGPVGIVVVSLSILMICYWRAESVKPESLIIDTKNLFFHNINYSQSQITGQRTCCNCTNHTESNNCSKLWIKPLQQFRNKRQQLPQKLCKELSLLQNMQHPNVNPLIGAIVENQDLYLLTPYCIRGSLQDILSDVSITFKKPVIISLIQDLICGLTYIHHSSIKCHGRLKSSNCLVNSCLRLRIADFGIDQLREMTPKESTSNLVDRLWLAPEQLRNQNYVPSWQADIYAFSIVLHEILHRQGPFNITAVPSVDVSFMLDQIKQTTFSNGSAKLFRPKIVDSSNLEFGCPFYIRHCLQDCWRESPSMRPNTDEIFCRLSLMKNETYTPVVTNPDDELIVLLQQEKEKKSKLLGNIIPRYAANELMKDLQVKPQVFESVTLVFTNIANFRQISESSSPHEQVNLLNDLYRIFDSIVQRYHVYKVETVKDTYFVASGLFPSETHHTTEAALLALDLLNSLKNYRALHNPHLAVLLRLGMHLGPVAAGVIGLDKPRFCLFGDTVNMTSRLSTTAEPSHIHISTECHLALVRIGGFIAAERGLIYLKGKGMRKTYWLTGTDHLRNSNSPSPE